MVRDTKSDAEAEADETIDVFDTVVRERDELRAEVERCREVVKTFTLGNAVLEVENVRLRNLLAECFPLVRPGTDLNRRLRDALDTTKCRLT